jgi:deoxycytidylate deaminase
MHGNEPREVQVELAYPEAELVFGLVYAAGTDYTGVQLTLENYIKRFNYKPNPIRLSTFISKILEKIDIGVVLDEKTEGGRINSLMSAGNKLCEIAKDESFLVAGAVAEINRNRKISDTPNTQEPLPKAAHILLSLKRPKEVELLRAIYGSGFYLIGVFASERDRYQYLSKDKNISRSEAILLMHRDEDEEIPFGQRSRDTFQLADVFIQLGSDQYKQQLERFLDLIFGNPFLTPEPDEHAMFLAYSAALRSGQLARQVGSAIRSANGEIIAIGCNDVPRAGGGLYWPGVDDTRDHIRRFDSNDMEQAAIVKDLINKLGLVLTYREALDKLKGSRLMDITEYGRAVHAEMDALLACARTGVSPLGGMLFTTTFPCHNCTRHLIASGIKRVVYIEPYPKSFASKLHRDSIELPGTRAFEKSDGRFRIPFEPFVGIGPRRFFDLFSMKLSSGSPVKRKKPSGRLYPWKRDESSPRIQMLPTSYTQREQLAAARFKSTLDKLMEEQSGIQRLPFEKN